MRIPPTQPTGSAVPPISATGADGEAESERRYRELFEGMPIALYRVRADGAMVAINQALAELLGATTVGGLLGKNANQVYVDPSVRTRMLERFAAGENNLSYETQFRRVDGSTFWAYCRARAIRDASGALECIEGAVADVSDRVAAEKALRESEERYRSLFDSSPLPTWVYDVETLRFLAVNEAAVKHYGYSRAELLSMTICDIRPPEDLPRLQEVLGQRPSIDREYKGQFRHRKKNGEVINVDIGSHRFVFDGRLADAVVVRDTTEATRTEIALVDAQRRLQHILASSNTVMFMLQPDGGLLHTEYVSDNLERITGYTVSEAHEDGWWARNLHPEDVDRALAELAALTNERDQTSEYRFRAKDGHYVWIRATHRIVPTDSGESRLISAWIDITEQRNLETQLFQSQKMEAIGQLAGGIAHDFNNILTAILGTAELGMMNANLGEETRGDLESIRSSGQRAAKITRQLLAFSRKQVIQPRTVLMNETVQEMLPMINRLLTMGVELETELAAVGAIDADPVQLEQVMLNLAVNARDAMPNGGTLAISTRDLRLDGGHRTDGQSIAPGDYVALVVRDTGVGMDTATQARIFEPFFTTKAPGAGTGLGLATVYGIVKQSSGHILVRSAPGQGTIFTILFPRAAAVAECAEPSGQHDVSGEEVILVVEDEAAVRAPICRALKEYGYHVLEAKHGADALLVLSAYKAPIDLVISDVMMPEMTGTELVSMLKRWYPKLRGILISGYSEELINARGTIPDGVRYMPKPFSMHELAKAARDALDDESTKIAVDAAD
jgi:two-component system, cell cycle sensor histidine kinase and response regulator CckA